MSIAPFASLASAISARTLASLAGVEADGQPADLDRPPIAAPASVAVGDHHGARAPSAAKRRISARPMPPAPPVTTMCLSRSSISAYSM